MEIYRFRNYCGQYLNIEGNNITMLSEHQNVTVWRNTNALEQRWEITGLGSGTSVKITSAVDASYALNYYWTNGADKPGTCDVYPWKDNEYDAQIDLIKDGNYYRIKLANYDLYLTAEGSYDGANVKWDKYRESGLAANYQLWEKETDQVYTK